MRYATCFLLAGLLLLVGPGCRQDEFFALEVPSDEPWPTANDLDAAAVGSYYLLTGRGGWQSLMGARRLHNTFTADIGQYVHRQGDDASADAVYYREGGEFGTFSNVFANGYRIISNANAVFELIDENDGQPYPASDSKRGQVPRIEGELRALRAFAYWTMAQIFAPPYNEANRGIQTELPWRVEPARTLGEANRTELATVGQLYDLMVSDLQRAKEILPERYDPALGHPETYGKGRINRFAAAALLARVYLTMGMVQEAGQEADFVITQGGDYDLAEDPIEAFSKGDAERGRETIWWYNFGAEGADGLGAERSNWKRPGRFSYFNWTDEANWNTPDSLGSNGRRFAASDAFLREAGWQDADLNETEAALRDKRYTQLYVRVPAGEDPRYDDFDRPYVWGNKYFRGTRSDRSNIIMIRLAEMYLTRALARFQAGDAAGAADDLNAIRERAWNAEVAGAPYTPLTAADVTEALIHRERMIEMAMEGDRLPYLRSLGMMIPPGDREGVEPIPPDYPGLIFEIPNSERQRNQVFQEGT